MKKIAISGLVFGLIGGILLKYKKTRDKIHEETVRKIKSIEKEIM